MKFFRVAVPQQTNAQGPPSIYLVAEEHRKEHARNEQLYRQIMQDKATLEQAVREIRVLKGLLPICASCKKIRDDGGYWHQLEAYLSHHAEVKFSHGICPDCERAYYADYEVYCDGPPGGKP